MENYDERREFVRMPSSASVQVCKGRKNAAGKVLDISPGGCQLLAKLELERGDNLKLRFSLNPGDPFVEIQGAVKWIRSDPDAAGHRFGIQFAEREKFEKLGPMFLDYLAFKKKMGLLRKEKRKGES